MDRIEYEDLEPSDDHLVLTYHGHPFMGVAFELNPNGQLISETEFVDGQRSGISRDWNSNGILVREQHYKFGSLYGRFKEWNENGLLIKDSCYELGIRLWEKQFDDTGKLLNDFVLSAGSPQECLLNKLRTGSIGLATKND